MLLEAIAPRSSSLRPCAREIDRHRTIPFRSARRASISTLPRLSLLAQRSSPMARNNQMWEFERFSWHTLRSANSAANIPQAIEDLRTATDEDSARSAYWRIDNEVVV